jgi:histone-lysine N-methyltransferase SETMAR
MDPTFIDGRTQDYTAACTMETIQKLKWNVLPHPPYSSDLATSDYLLFGPLKEHVGGKNFCNNGVIQDVQEWLHGQPKDFLLSGIRKLPDRWRKCVSKQGDYVEQ